MFPDTQEKIVAFQESVRVMGVTLNKAVNVVAASAQVIAELRSHLDQLVGAMPTVDVAAAQAAADQFARAGDDLVGRVNQYDQLTRGMEKSQADANAQVAAANRRIEEMAGAAEELTAENTRMRKQVESLQATIEAEMLTPEVRARVKARLQDEKKRIDAELARLEAPMA